MLCENGSKVIRSFRGLDQDKQLTLRIEGEGTSSLKLSYESESALSFVRSWLRGVKFYKDGCDSCLVESRVTRFPEKLCLNLPPCKEIKQIRDFIPPFPIDRESLPLHFALDWILLVSLIKALREESRPAAGGIRSPLWKQKDSYLKWICSLMDGMKEPFLSLHV